MCSRARHQPPLWKNMGQHRCQSHQTKHVRIRKCCYSQPGGALHYRHVGLALRLRIADCGGFSWRTSWGGAPRQLEHTSAVTTSSGNTTTTTTTTTNCSCVHYSYYNSYGCAWFCLFSAWRHATRRTKRATQPIRACNASIHFCDWPKTNLAKHAGQYLILPAVLGMRVWNIQRPTALRRTTCPRRQKRRPTPPQV